MTHSLISPMLVSNVVNLVFYRSFFGSGRELSRFYKMTRRSKMLGRKWLMFSK